jgi:DNA-binding response OmpR family regulator
MAYVIAVDDDHGVLETLGRVLGREGYESTLFNSAREVYRELDERLPDLLILDMPTLTGESAFCQSADSVSHGEGDHGRYCGRVGRGRR